MTKFHRTTQTLNLALELARGILKLQKRLKDTDAECKHEIDNCSQLAQYVILEVEHREHVSKEKEG